MATQHLNVVSLSALTTTTQMSVMILFYVYKCVLKVGMLMMKANIVLLNVHFLIKLMGRILPINVLRSVLLANMLRMIPECVCIIVLGEALLIIMLEFVLLCALLFLIFMVNLFLIRAWSNVHLLLIGMLIILQGYVYLNVHSISLHSQID